MNVAPQTATGRQPTTAGLSVEWLGRVPYGEALALQDAAVAERRAGGPDRLLLLEHPPVVTLGRSTRRENLRASPEALAARGVECFEVARGGDVTWHGPGQLVGYVIADLAARGTPDAHVWLRTIEATLIEALDALGVPARALPGMTGVFLEREGQGGVPLKIASIGVGLRGWISWHGFALNATPDLRGFDDIVPCGLSGARMTSLAEALDQPPTEALFARAREAVAASFRRVLA
ncbi:MAG: lipoyl(octanoyl) transferase LipB [Myxococcota bacterium]